MPGCPPESLVQTGTSRAAPKTQSSLWFDCTTDVSECQSDPRDTGGPEPIFDTT